MAPVRLSPRLRAGLSERGRGALRAARSGSGRAARATATGVSRGVSAGVTYGLAAGTALGREGLRRGDPVGRLGRLTDPAAGATEVGADDVRRRVGYLTLPAVVAGWIALGAGDAGGATRTLGVAAAVAAPVLGLVAGLLVLLRSFPPGRTALLTGALAGAPFALLGVAAVLVVDRERTVAGATAYVCPVLATSLALAGVGAYRARGRLRAVGLVLATAVVAVPPTLVVAAFAAHVTNLALPVALVPLHFLGVRAALAPLADEL